MSYNPGEMIYCVPDREVRKSGINEPYHPDPPSQAVAKLLGLATFQMRGRVEEDEQWRQLIPYVVSRCKGRILLIERLPSQGESRLHNLLSIGVGGHINPTDSVNGGRNILENAMWREMKEELDFDDKPETTLAGIINFRGDPVARVHLGFTYIADFPVQPDIRELDKMRGKFVRPRDLTSYYSRMEGWSQVLVDHLRL
jgi:predicted NUDIX family phosphoesterase